MKMFNNYGELVAELNVVLTGNGSITTNTMYNTCTGSVVSQHVMVIDKRSGTVRSETVFGGKLLP
jgi:phage-related protein